MRIAIIVGVVMMRNKSKSQNQLLESQRDDFLECEDFDEVMERDDIDEELFKVGEGEVKPKRSKK